MQGGAERTVGFGYSWPHDENTSPAAATLSRSEHRDTDLERWVRIAPPHEPTSSSTSSSASFIQAGIAASFLYCSGT